MMSILQVYKADLLRDHSEGEGVGPDAVQELCWATDLSLWATTETFRSFPQKSWGSGQHSQLKPPKQKMNMRTVLLVKKA